MRLETYAVMGNPIAHSLSPLIHQQFASNVGKTIHYERILVESDFEAQVTLFFEQGGLGLNITAPFKEQAFAMSEIRTSRCQRACSANTLWMEKGLLHADNTDGIGLCRALEKVLTLSGRRVLILGAGGAARGIIPALQDNGVHITLVNRTLERAMLLSIALDDISVIDMQERVGEFDVLINATAGQLDVEALPTTWLAPRPYCYDLTYCKAAKTPFVQWANTHYCIASDGFSMLVEQAREAFTIWHGISPM